MLILRVGRDIMTDRPQNLIRKALVIIVNFFPGKKDRVEMHFFQFGPDLVLRFFVLDDLAWPADPYISGAFVNRAQAGGQTTFAGLIYCLAAFYLYFDRQAIGYNNCF